MTELGCDYSGREFGACYDDSVCIDGYLWDADDCDAEGNLYSGGDIPCPQCNHGEWLRYCGENIENDGYFAYEDDGEKEEDCPFFEGCKLKYPEDWKVFREYWMKGYHTAMKENSND
jgi:hypothetical protein